MRHGWMREREQQQALIAKCVTKSGLECGEIGHKTQVVATVSALAGSPSVGAGDDASSNGAVPVSVLFD